MAISPVLLKGIAGVGVVGVAATGVVFRKEIYETFAGNVNYLKSLGLPEVCHSSSTNSCKLNANELKNLKFIFDSETKGKSTTPNNGTNPIVDLGWTNTGTMEEITFSIKAKTDSVTLTNGNKTIVIPSTDGGMKFRLKEETNTENKKEYYFGAEQLVKELGANLKCESGGSCSKLDSTANINGLDADATITKESTTEKTEYPDGYKYKVIHSPQNTTSGYYKLEFDGTNKKWKLTKVGDLPASTVDTSQNVSKLNNLTFLPESCRNSPSTTSCDLTFGDLKKIEFVFTDSDKKVPTIDGSSDDASQAATLSWEVIAEADFPSNLLFTIIPKNGSEINLKKDSEETNKISIPLTVGTRFQLEAGEGKHYFKKHKLTTWDSKLIEKINGLQKFTSVSTEGTSTTATSTDAKIKLSLTTTKSPSESPTTSKFEFKVEVSSPSDTETEIISGVKVWECIIQGTKQSTDEELFVDDTGKADQISKLKKSFGMDQASTGEKTLEEKHKKSIVKFITQCANSAENIPSPDSSEKKLTRTITKNMESVSGQTKKLQFQEFEGFFIEEVAN